MTDKQDLIREIHEYVAAHGGENTATHLLVQAASAIQTQAAELEAVGAGGVQALSAAPAIGDELRDTLVAVSAAIAERDDRAAQKMICEILAASTTPPAEQQAQPGAVYAELPQPDSWFHFTAQFWENKLYDFADRTHALRQAVIAPELQAEARRRYDAAMEQAAPKAAPTRTALPEGWTDCTIEFGNDGPEVVAYGPKRMMTRLAKWLGKYFAQVIAEAAPKAAPGEQNTVPAEWLEQAYREGWAACRDAETIGEEAEDWAFGNSTANSRMIDAQQAAPKQEAQEPGEIPESIERMATGRYKVVPSHESMFHRWAVVAGSGTQQLYLGSEVECQNMARKFAGAFLDGAFVTMQSTSPNPAPAPLSEQDPLQGAANWLAQAHGQFCVSVLQGCLMIGHNRAKRLHDAALAAQGGKCPMRIEP